MNEVSKNLRCISIRNGVEIWVEEEKVKKLQDVLSNIRQSTFVHFGERTINTADVVGIFTARDMADLTNRKNGKWKCDEGFWHDRNTTCDCASKEERDRSLKIAEAIANCGKCNNGYVYRGSGVEKCECIAGL